MLKLASPAIIPALTNFYNHSHCIGCIPTQCKCANGVPVYNRGDKTNMLNYRPVSLTSIVCKLLEKVVVKQLLDHCLDNELIASQQHGFLHGRSCTTGLCIRESRLIGYQLAPGYLKDLYLAACFL